MTYDLNHNPTLYFGAKYPSDDFSAPRYDGATKVGTPVGQRCYYCEEEIVEGDRGIMQSCLIRKNEDGEHFWTVEPIHTECDLRQVIGSLKHIQHMCSCFGVESDLNPEEGMTRREAAVAAVRAWEKMADEKGWWAE